MFKFKLSIYDLMVINKYASLTMILIYGQREESFFIEQDESASLRPKSRFIYLQQSVPQHGFSFFVSFVFPV